MKIANRENLIETFGSKGEMIHHAIAAEQEFDNPTDYIESVMEAANVLLNGYGVVGVEDENEMLIGLYVDRPYHAWTLFYHEPSDTFLIAKVREIL